MAIDHGPSPTALSPATATDYVVVIVCDSRLGRALSRRFPMANRENWAPFEAWRCMDAGRGAFILSIGPHPSAVDAGVALAMAKFPAAPVVFLAPARPCDPSLDDIPWFVCDPISAFSKKTLYLMADPSAEERGAARSLRGDKDLVLMACEHLTASATSCGSCEGEVDFVAQARWLHRHLGIGICDQRAFSAACRLADGDRRWVVLAYGAGGDPAAAQSLDGLARLVTGSLKTTAK